MEQPAERLAQRCCNLYNTRYHAHQQGRIKGETVMANKEQRPAKEKKKPKKDGKKSGGKAQG
jgi:hypothetical protein